MRSKRLKPMVLCVVGLLLVVCALVGWHRYEYASSRADVHQRILKIANQLRAPGDQNTMTVATSQSEVAQHMRYEIQQELLANKTDAEVIQDMVREYGEDVYAAPPFRGFGTLVWIMPVLFLAVLVVAIVAVLRRSTREIRDSVAIEKEPLLAKTAAAADDPDILREYF